MKKGSLFLIILSLIMVIPLVIAPAPPIDCTNTPNSPFCNGGLPADCDISPNNPLCFGLTIKSRGNYETIAYNFDTEQYFGIGNITNYRNGTLNSENNWYNRTHKPIIICEKEKTPFDICKDIHIKRVNGRSINLEQIPVYNLKEVKAPKWITN